MMNKLLITLLLTGSVFIAPAAVAESEYNNGLEANGRTAGYVSEVSLTNIGIPTLPKMGVKTPNMKTSPQNVAPAAGSSYSNNNGNFMGAPLNAKPGECYGRVTTPAIKKSVNEDILVKAAGKKISRIVPAEYKTVTENITVQEAGEELVTIPATYKTVTETVVVTPASTRKTSVPAEYAAESERVLVKPAQTVWKQGVGPNQRVDNVTGDVMCLVEEPAVYKTVAKRVLVSAATTREETVPAVTKTITKRVIDQPARVDRRAIAPVTKTITKRVLVEPERVVYEDTAPEYRTVQQEVIVQDEKVAWSKILCKTNADRTTVTQLQSALKDAGYNPGKVDGVLGSQTYSAVNRFQRDNNLMRGQITLETIERLGLPS